MSGYTRLTGARAGTRGRGRRRLAAGRARVWLLRDGRVGRVVALSQGGLLCHVRPEEGGATLRRPGCELLPLASDGPPCRSEATHIAY
jgi:hypothetical protein